LHLVGYKSILE